MKRRAGFRWVSDDQEQRLYYVTAGGYGRGVWGSWYGRHMRRDKELGIRWESADWQLTRPVTRLFVLLKTREVINAE